MQATKSIVVQLILLITTVFVCNWRSVQSQIIHHDQNRKVNSKRKLDGSDHLKGNKSRHRHNKLLIRVGDGDEKQKTLENEEDMLGEDDAFVGRFLQNYLRSLD